MKDAASIAGDEAERMAFYEYSLGLDSVPRWAGKKLSAMSDRDEAKLIVDWIQAECKKITPNKRQLINMRELDEMIAEWD